MSKKTSTDELWYQDGLRFKCTGCGKCCGGAPGYVWLADSDIDRLASHLQLSKEEFLRRHCRQVGRRFSLKESSINYNCTFLKDQKCSVYEARPHQCRSYPFWGKIVENKENWRAEKRECEGIDSPDADLIPLETIIKKLREKE